MRKSYILLLLMVVSPPLVESVKVSKVIKFAKSAIELVISVDDLWQVVNVYGQFVETPFDEKERALYLKIDQISMRIEDLNERIKVIDENIKSLVEMIRKLPQKVLYEIHLDNLRNYQLFIDQSYNQMQKFVTNREDYENSTILSFCEKVISYDTNSVKSLTESIQFIITRSDFLKQLSEQLQETSAEINCNKGQSSQQLLYGILNQLLLTNFKSYITMQFAYFTKIIHKQGRFKKEIEDATNSFKKRINDIITNIKKHMVMVSNELWRCDPEKHEIGKTYEQITNFLQGFIINTANLDPTGQCRDSCDTYNYVTRYYKCGESNWCSNQRFCAKILNCQRFDSDMKVCLSKDDNKRYEYVEHDNGRIFGKKGGCRRRGDVSYLSEYRNWVIWKCSFCFCLCDEDRGRNSDKYISLRAAMSDINNNRVVTGVRFVKRNRIIHLQIQQGKLLPEGRIDINTVQWVPVDDFKVADKTNFYEGQDFHTLSWEERGIELNSVLTDDFYLVTGVRFLKIGSRLELEVLTTPYNFTTGKLINPWGQSYYKNTPNMNLRHKFGKELALIRPDVPIRSKSSSIPHTGSANYVQFTNSDYDKDAAQTTVPFFDIQEVASSVPVPLMGVGIYYKGQNGYGGFIAPKIYTFNLSQYLAPVFEIN